MQQRFLDPRVLATLASLELTAKTVVEGFIAGLHRSPEFGFSQEFAEYRPYTMGDDLRMVDWNVFARSERMYLKRYRGETNTRVNILLDRSASMGFKRGGAVSKIDYARFAAASLAYMAHHQRDAISVITFDDEVREFVPPSSRQGQLHRVLHAIEKAEPETPRTDFSRPFTHFQGFHHWRGIAIVLSDFYGDPKEIVKIVAPLRHRGNDVILFHVLDPDELKPAIEGSRLLIDMETKETIEVSGEYAAQVYTQRIQDHCTALKSAAEGEGLSWFLLNTGEPLDATLRAYLGVRQGRM